MGIFDRFGKKTADKTSPKPEPSYQNAPKVEKTVDQVSIPSEWHDFFRVVALHESAQKALMAFVGKWPDGLDPNVFLPSNLDIILRRVRDH